MYNINLQEMSRMPLTSIIILIIYFSILHVRKYNKLLPLTAVLQNRRRILGDNDFCCERFRDARLFRVRLTGNYHDILYSIICRFIDYNNYYYVYIFTL